MYVRTAIQGLFPSPGSASLYLVADLFQVLEPYRFLVGRRRKHVSLDPCIGYLQALIKLILAMNLRRDIFISLFVDVEP